VPVGIGLCSPALPGGQQRQPRLHSRLAADHDLRLAFEATADLDPAGQAMVKHLIEAVLLQHQARRWAS
jgi:energy-coupling factor transporter ATP-binding protein EcfA2